MAWPQLPIATSILGVLVLASSCSASSQHPTAPPAVAVTEAPVEPTSSAPSRSVPAPRGLFPSWKSTPNTRDCSKAYRPYCIGEYNLQCTGDANGCTVCTCVKGLPGNPPGEPPLVPQ